LFEYLEQFPYEVWTPFVTQRFQFKDGENCVTNFITVRDIELPQTHEES
jgi:hypothetical protein